MHSRSGNLEHPLGGALHLPCLTPSFSSKGFALVQNQPGETGYSEVDYALQACGNTLGHSVLLSAYDLHHKLIPSALSVFDKQRFILLDSGGYELSATPDTTDPTSLPSTPKKFDRKAHYAVLRSIPPEVKLIVTNYDWDMRGQPCSIQISKAEEFFAEFPLAIHDFLLKPINKDLYICVDNLRQHLNSLKDFKIVGVTEKELGRELKDRLAKLVKLRELLDELDDPPAIHVWGGLDPLITPLYFIAGAQIFDGVSWLRYAYINGLATYRDVFSILLTGLDVPIAVAQAAMVRHNLQQLAILENRLTRFAESSEADFTLFPWYQDEYRTIFARLEERRAGSGGAM